MVLKVKWFKEASCIGSKGADDRTCRVPIRMLTLAFGLSLLSKVFMSCCRVGRVLKPAERVLWQTYNPTMGKVYDLLGTNN